MPKLDFVRIWAGSANANIFALTETWLKKSVGDNDIAIGGYNAFLADRKSKGGGIIYEKSKYHSTLKSMGRKMF